MQATKRRNRTEVQTPMETKDHALVDLGWKARDIALYLGDATRGKPGVGWIFTYEENNFSVELRRETRNAYVRRYGELVFVGLLCRPPFGEGASVRVHDKRLISSAASRILPLHHKAQQVKESQDENAPADPVTVPQHVIDGGAVEEHETVEGWQVLARPDERQVAVRWDDFVDVDQERRRLKEENERLREQLDRYETFVIELGHDSIPKKERFPCCADRAAEVQDKIEELREDLAEGVA